MMGFQKEMKNFKKGEEKSTASNSTRGPRENRKEIQSKVLNTCVHQGCFLPAGQAWVGRFCEQCHEFTLLLQEDFLFHTPELIRLLPEPWYSQGAEACPLKCPSLMRRAGRRSEKTEPITHRRAEQFPKGHLGSDQVGVTPLAKVVWGLWGPQTDAPWVGVGAAFLQKTPGTGEDCIFKEVPTVQSKGWGTCQGLQCPQPSSVVGKPSKRMLCGCFWPDLFAIRERETQSESHMGNEKSLYTFLLIHS